MSLGHGAIPLSGRSRHQRPDKAEKAISEVQSVIAYNGAWAVCPEGATAFLCMGTNPNNVTMATQPSGHYCNGQGFNQMTASCLKIGITAAAVAEAEGGE